MDTTFATASVSRNAVSNETLGLIGPCTVIRKSLPMNWSSSR